MSPLSMLLIEDSASEARLIRELICEAPQHKVELRHATTLAEGLQALEEGGIDLVLLDLSLPDSHGLETLRSVRTAVSRVPVIVLTGSDEEELALNAVEKGAQDYLVKGQVDGKAILRSARYAIARARTLEALRESQRFIDQVADLLYIVDLESLSIDHLSPQMESLLGPAAKIRGPLSELIHAEDLGEFHRRMKQAPEMPEGDVIESEFRLRTGGGWCWVHARETLFMRGSAGSPDLLLGTVQVLTHRPDDVVLNSEIQLLKSVFDSLPQPIFVKDANGRFLLSNAAHRRLLGVADEEQVVGKTDFELLPTKEAEQNLADELQLLENACNNNAAGTIESRGQQPSNAQFEKRALRDTSGAVIGLLAVGASKG